MTATTKINCLNCNKEIFVATREIKRGNGKFCDRSCSSQHKSKIAPKPKNNVVCAHCQKEFYINNSKRKNSRSGLFFCCRDHKDISQRIGGIKEIQPPHYGETHSCYRTVVFEIQKKPRQCERCSYNKHEAAIIVHHKDKNRKNNDPSNLEVLCANCHAIEHWSLSSLVPPLGIEPS